MRFYPRCWITELRPIGFVVLLFFSLAASAQAEHARIVAPTPPMAAPSGD
jgi:hypothetical protein